MNLKKATGAGLLALALAAMHRHANVRATTPLKPNLRRVIVFPSW